MSSQNTKTGGNQADGTVQEGTKTANSQGDLGTATGTKTKPENSQDDPNTPTENSQGDPNTATGNEGGVGTTQGQPSSKFQVAAAVGLTVSSHDVQSLISGRLTTGGNVGAASINEGNFKTLGTGAAMSLAANSNSIAAGVAVSVNNNTALTDVSGIIRAGSEENPGDASFTADLTQNMDDDFRGKLAAQSLAGAVSGANGKVSIAGAVSVLVSNAETKVTVGDNSKGSTDVTATGAMKISAADKSKLAARAGAVSISKGSAVGVGASVVTIVSNNTVEAKVADNTHLTAKRLDLIAERRRVDMSDFIFPMNMSTLLTDSSALSEEERKEANTGMIDIHKGPDDKSYKVEIHVTSDKLLEAVDLLNFLSFTNYYAEAIAGSIMSSAGANSQASVAGSVAVLYFSNTVNALIGKNAVIDCTGSDPAAGPDNGDGVTIAALDSTNVRTIAGSLSVAPSKVGVGATIAYLQNKDKVKTEVGEGTQISTPGFYNQKAQTDADIQLFTVAASVGTGASNANIAGAVNAIAADNEAYSTVGSNAKITAGRDLSVTSKTDMDMLLISASASASVAGNVAAGGTVDVIVNKAKSWTTVGDGAKLTAGAVPGGSAQQTAAGNLSIISDTLSKMISVIASVSASPGTATTVAGSLGVLVDQSDTQTKVGNSAELKAANGDIDLLANADSVAANACIAASGSAGGTAAGAVINVNVFNRTVKTLTGDNAQITAGGNVSSQTAGKDVTVIISAAASGSGGSGAISGTIPVAVALNTFEHSIGAGTTVKAGGSIGTLAHLSERVVGAAGGISVAGSGIAVGATVQTVVLKNTVTNLISSGAKLIAAAEKTLKEMKNGKDITGVYVGADSSESVVVASIGVSGSAAGAAVNGVINTLVVNNTIKAQAKDSILAAGYDVQFTTEDGKEKAVYRKTGTAGNVTVEALDDTLLVNVSGALSASSSIAVGATVPVIVFGKTVEADAAGSTVRAAGAANVYADSKDNVWELAIAASVAGSAAVTPGVDVLVFNSTTKAGSGKDMLSGGQAAVDAKSNTKLHTIAAAASVSGSAAVTPVAVVAYFNGTTSANAGDGASIVSENEGVRVSADSLEDILTSTMGMAASGAASVSGAVNVYVTKLKTLAQTGTGATLSGQKDVIVTAVDDYRYLGISGTVAAAGEAGVSVNAIVNVAKNTVGANVGAANTVTSGTGDVNVNADAKRDVGSYAASASVGGAAGVGVTIMVDVIGGKLQQDSADALNDGLQKDKDGNFTLMEYLGFNHKDAQEGINTVSLEEDLEGDGINDSGNSVDGDINIADAYGDETDPDQDKDGSEDESDPGQTGDDNPDGDGDQTGDDNPDGDGNQYDNGDQYDEDAPNGYGVQAGGDAPNGYGNQDSGNDSGSGDDFSYDYGDDDTDPDQNDDNPDDDTHENKPEPTQADKLDSAAGLGRADRKGQTRQDSVTATIGAGSKVTAAGDISVHAHDFLQVDSFSGTVSAGGAAGVGVGVSVLVSFSNVEAKVYEGALLDAGGNVDIYAGSTSSERKNASGETASLSGMKVKGQDDNDTFDLNLSKSGLRVISVTAAGGTAGVAVPVAVLTMESSVRAELAGNVTAAQNVNVDSLTEYGNTVAATLAVGAGVAGVSVPVAVVRSAGEGISAVTGSSVTASGGLNVTGTHSMKAHSITVPISGGAVAANVAVPVAVNRMYAETYISDNTDVDVENVKVHTDMNTEAKATQLGASIGAVAAGIGVAVVIDEPEVYTYIGCNPDAQEQSSSGQPQQTDGSETGSGTAQETAGNSTGSAQETVKTVKARGNVEVSHTVKSQATPQLAKLAAGAISVNANVLLAFNRTKAVAGITRGNVDAKGDVTVSAYAPSVKATSTFYSLAAGAISGGLSSSYAQLRMVNEALLDSTGVTISGKNIYVTAGTENKKNIAGADVKTVSGALGAAAVNINAAVADNNVTNRAKVIGDGTITATGTSAGQAKPSGSAAVESWLEASSDAALVGLEIGAADAAAATVIALNRVENTASLGGGTLNAGSVSVKAVLNGSGDDLANADIHTGGGSLGAVKINTGVAVSRAANNAVFSASNGEIGGALNVLSTGNANAKSTSWNCSFDVISAALNLNYARTLGSFLAKIELPDGAVLNAGSIEVKTDYAADSDAEVTPSAGGIDVSLMSVKVNLAFAITGLSSDAVFTGNGKVTTQGTVNVFAEGTADATALVHSADFIASVVSATASNATALLKAVQNAELSGVDLTTNGNDVQVISRLNEDGTNGADASPSAETTLAKISKYSVEVNTVEAINRASGIAKIDGASITAGAGNVKTLSTGTSKANARKSGKNVSLSMVGLGVLAMYAYADGTFTSCVNDTQIVSAAALDVLTQYSADAFAESAQPDHGFSGGAISVDGNLAIAAVNTDASAYISGKSDIETAGDIRVLVGGTPEDESKLEETKAAVTAKTDIQGTEISVEGITLAGSYSRTNVNANQKAYISGPGKDTEGYAGVRSTGGRVVVLSNLDTVSNAVIGADKISVSGVDAKISYADSRSDAVNMAYAEDAKIQAEEGRIVIAADLSTKTTPGANVGNPKVELSLVSLGATVSTSDSNDIVKAYVGGDKGSRLTALEVDITATSDAEVTVSGGAPRTSIKAVSAQATVVKAEAGKGDDGKITHAYIGSGSEVYANGTANEADPDDDSPHSLNIKADSKLSIQAILPVTCHLSGFEFGVYYLSTDVGQTDTSACIDGYAFSADDINVSANDAISEKAETAIFSASLAKTGVSKVENTIGSSTVKKIKDEKGKEKEVTVIRTQHTSAGFGDGANVEAWGNINADAVSRTDAQSGISDASISAYEGGEMELKTTVYRRTDAFVGDNANVKSVIGNILINASEDADGVLEANLTGSSLSFIKTEEGGKPKSTVENHSWVEMNVGGGSRIDAKYGTLKLTATAAHQLHASTVRRAAAAIALNRSESIVKDTVNVIVRIAEGKTDPTVILGSYTTIGAYINGQEDRAYALSHTASAGSHTYADATLNANNTVLTKIDNASVGGIETLRIESIVVKQSLKAQTHAEIIGFTGWVTQNPPSTDTIM